MIWVDVSFALHKKNKPEIYPGENPLTRKCNPIFGNELPDDPMDPFIGKGKQEFEELPLHDSSVELDEFCGSDSEDPFSAVASQPLLSVNSLEGSLRLNNVQKVSLLKHVPTFRQKDSPCYKVWPIQSRSWFFSYQGPMN